MSLRAPDCACDHVDELHSDAHMARRKEQTFDQVCLVGSVLIGFPYKALVLNTHSLIFTPSSVISDDQSKTVPATFARNVLKMILKSFGDGLVGPKIEVFL